MRSGGKTYIMSQIDVVAMRKYIVQYPLNRVLTLPPIIHYLNEINDLEVFRSLAALRELYVVAAPLGSALQTEFRDKLYEAGRAAGQDYQVKIVQVWGMTELSAAVSPHILLISS
jgi:acyl-coenzyme A synthetase/AMP-(fatty) acid ligase